MHLNEENAIRQVFDRYLRLYAAGEEYHSECLSEDFSGFGCADTVLSKNRTEWLATQHQHLTQAKAPLSIELKDVLIQLVTHTTAIATGVLVITTTAAEHTLEPTTARLVLVLSKELHGWKIAHSSLSVAHDFIKGSENDAGQALMQRNQFLEQQLAQQTQQLSQLQEQLALSTQQLAHTILEHEQTEEALRKSEAHFRMLTENAVDVVWKLDDEYRFTYISPADEKQRGYRADEVIGHRVFEMFDDDGIAAIVKAGQKRHEAEHMGMPLTDVTFEARHRCKDGSWIWGEVCYNPEFDAKGQVIGFYGMSREITERKNMQDQVRLLAFYDPLTKLPNRHLLNDRLAQALAASKRNGCYGALMFLDLDNFKPINDSHGHIAGDLLLVEVARRLIQCVREIDTIARFGGDEFIVVLSELHSDEAQAYAQAQAVAEKIRHALAVIYQITLNCDGKADIEIEHACTASIGVVLFLGQEVGIEGLFKRADTAMYDAKEGGRNTIRFYNRTDLKPVPVLA